MSKADLLASTAVPTSAGVVFVLLRQSGGQIAHTVGEVDFLTPRWGDSGRSPVDDIEWVKARMMDQVGIGENAWRDLYQCQPRPRVTGE